MSQAVQFPTLGVGDEVEVNAGWTPVRRGVVDQVEALGFRVKVATVPQGHTMRYPLWFGWHEFVRVVRRAEPHE
jgi:hypothetical protein